MFIPDASGFEIILIGGFEDFGKDLKETAIVFLQDGVLGREVQRPVKKRREEGGGEGLENNLEKRIKRVQRGQS